jgi:hypothetical protein
MASIVLRSVERSLESEGSGKSEWKVLRDGGNEKFDDGQYAKACEQYSDALMFISLTDRPARVHLLTNRALSHLKAGKPNQAICDCESVLHLAPLPDAGSKAPRDLKTAEVVMKALYIKGVACREKGDAEAARCDLRLVKELSDAKKDLLVTQDRAHLLQLLKDLGVEEQHGGGVAGALAAAMRLLRRLTQQLVSHLFWHIGPLFVVWGAWVYLSVWLCSSATTAQEGLFLDVQRAQTMSAVGAMVLTLLWHSWSRWEEAQKAKHGGAFRSLREQVKGWWAVSRALGLLTTARLVSAQLAPALETVLRRGGGAAEGEQEEARSRLQHDIQDIMASLKSSQVCVCVCVCVCV